jgi:hypothetical protein
MEVAALHDLLSAIFSSVKVIVYLRRQDEYLLSLYSTAVQSGSTATLAEFADDQNESHRYDYSAILSRWSAAFGKANVICRRYERSRMEGGEIVTDFLTSAGMESFCSLPREMNRNRSLDAVSLEFLRRLNEQIGNDIDGGPRADILLAVSEQSSGPLPTLPQPKLRAFMGRYETSNRAVASDYFGDQFLFGASEDTRMRTSDAGLTIGRAIEITAGLVRRRPL